VYIAARTKLASQEKLERDETLERLRAQKAAIRQLAPLLGNARGSLAAASRIQGLPSGVASAVRNARTALDSAAVAAEQDLATIAQVLPRASAKARKATVATKKAQRAGLGEYHRTTTKRRRAARPAGRIGAIARKPRATRGRGGKR